MFPFGAIAGPILEAVAQSLLKELLGGKRRHKRVRYVQRQSFSKMMNHTKTTDFTDWTFFCS